MILITWDGKNPSVSRSMRRRLLINGIEETKAGDICLYDSVNYSKVIVPYDIYTLEEYPSVQYTPIGVVAVPCAHTEDGTARIISLTDMDYNNPDNGTTDGNTAMSFGGSGYDIAGLDNCAWAPLITSGTTNFGDEQTITWNADGFMWISSDYFTDGPKNHYDNDYYYGSGSTQVPAFGASPYLTDGSKNELYSQSFESGGYKSFIEQMDGRVNTAAILAVDNGAGTDWKTAATITNTRNTETIHPAAQCCWRYHTIGTTQGEWYLPTAGELGYVVARFKSINESITKIINNGFPSVALAVPCALWSSTENGGNFAFSIVLRDGYAGVGNPNKYDDGHVRAFLAV